MEQGNLVMPRYRLIISLSDKDTESRSMLKLEFFVPVIISERKVSFFVVTDNSVGGVEQRLGIVFYLGS